ncbi:hypothetical protein DXG01_016957 [Tephrocybe rancida]|nr:hypothetical protein DXG01_016957 [Tephrocybe rancida]
MTNISASELHKKYTHFRILVIGRANAGKTTLLKRVCNTDEDPCIYDEKTKALRGLHDVNRPFAFASNPNFIFHFSSFEADDESQLIKVQSFIKERAMATDPDEQLHAIWFCLKLDKARFLQDLEKKFFSEDRSGNAPLIAILTKFDDLITQVYDTSLDYEKNRENAETERKKLEASLFSYKFPPNAGVYMEDMHNEQGNHQEQVKILIEKTATSLVAAQYIDPKQHINPKQKVEYSLERVQEHVFSMQAIAAELILDADYKKNLKKSIMFKGLLDCLLQIHLDIVMIWNLNDPDEAKSFPGFNQQQQLPVVTVLALRSQMALCYEAYIVDLMLILHELLVTELQPLTSELISEALKGYKDSRSEHIHQCIHNIPYKQRGIFSRTSHKEDIKDLIQYELGMESNDATSYQKLRESLKKYQAKAATFQSFKSKVAKSDPGRLKVLDGIHKEIQRIQQEIDGLEVPFTIKLDGFLYL